jgi:hypothetical protein
VQASWGTLGASFGVRLALGQNPAGPIFRAMAPWTPWTKRQTLMSSRSAGRLFELHFSFPPSQHSGGSAVGLRASGQRRSMPHRLDVVASGSTVASNLAQLQAPAVLPCVHWDITLATVPSSLSRTSSHHQRGHLLRYCCHAKLSTDPIDLARC